MLAKGKKALGRLLDFRARNWWSKEIPKFYNRLIDDYARRSEVCKGGKLSEGTVSATAIGLDMSNTWITIDGKMYPISSASGSITDLSDIDVLNSAGDKASLVITLDTGAPTISAACTLTISSGGVSFVVRFFDSNNGEEYDSSSNADIQIDVDLSTLTDETCRDAISSALASKFPNHTVVDTDPGSDHVITITAPIGAGYDFTYVESAAVANIAGVATASTKEVGGAIDTAGDAVSDATGASTPLYVALIATNSDNAGDELSEGSYAQVLAILSEEEAYPSSQAVQAALADSAGNVSGYDHSGASGWVHLAQLKNDNGTLTITSNLNNHLGV